jgi:Uma2 family endonuclease
MTSGSPVRLDGPAADGGSSLGVKASRVNGLKSRLRSRGAEPDECYTVGATKERPDLAIEVVWTHGGIDKLDVYRGLRVREVWIYKDGALELYPLRRNAYVRIPKSEVLPKLDLRELATYLRATDQTSAVRRYFKALQKRFS